MRTEELERMLGAALREADAPVDLQRGLSRLREAQDDARRSSRRWSVVAVAASFVAALVAVVLTVQYVERDDDTGPPAGPKLVRSPSGLPVGLLTGRVDRTEPGAMSTVRFVVRPDGSGVFNAGTTGDSEGDQVGDYGVTFVRAGPGGAVMRNAGDAACWATDVLTLRFTVRHRTVRIEGVDNYLAECIVSAGLAADLPGTTLRVQPLPQISPSSPPPPGR
jgi:hypothetical protein